MGGVIHNLEQPFWQTSGVSWQSLCGPQQTLSCLACGPLLTRNQEPPSEWRLLPTCGKQPLCRQVLVWQGLTNLLGHKQRRPTEANLNGEGISWRGAQ